VGQGVSYVAFCPERIHQTTADLDEQDYLDYMTCIEVQIFHYISHHAMPDRKTSA
jgi:hypothetical protein